MRRAGSGYSLKIRKTAFTPLLILHLYSRKWSQMKETRGAGLVVLLEGLFDLGVIGPALKRREHHRLVVRMVKRQTRATEISIDRPVGTAAVLKAQRVTELMGDHA